MSQLNSTVRTSAIIVGAGRSTRMGGVSKLFVEIGGRTVLERSIAAFADTGRIDSIVVVAREEDLARIEGFELSSKVLAVIPGGNERHDSVRSGLEYLKSQKISEDSIVMIHDAARCLVDKELIERVGKAAREYMAAAPVLKISDTVKHVTDDGFISGTTPRDKLRLIQTPQAFKFSLIWSAHQARTNDASDDCILVEKIQPVKVVDGSSSNIKITTQHDIKLVEFLLHSGHESSHFSV